MAGMHPIKSILTVVAFLVLVAIATVIYGGDEASQADREQNLLYQKTRLVLETTFGLARGLVNLGLSDGADSPDSWTVDEKAENLELASLSETGFWAKTVEKIKAEWENSNDDFDWRKTEDGAEIVFRTKNGREYKLPLFFKFLSNQSEN